MTSQSEREEVPLEIGSFFRESRTHGLYKYKASPGDANNSNLSRRTASDVQTSSALPFGREYTKETWSDGSLVWSEQRLLNGQPLVRVTVKPPSRLENSHWRDAFDAATLGQWSLVPEAYRTYWSFDSVCSELSNSPDARDASRRLCDKIEAYLEHSAVPAHVRRAMDRMRLKASLMADDMDRVSRSASAFAMDLCTDESVARDKALLELARIAHQIEKQYPKGAEQLLRPLVGRMVAHAGAEAVDALDGLTPAIDANNWFMYGNMVLEQIRAQGLGQADVIEHVAVRLRTLRLARERRVPDPCDDTPAVRQYLAQLDADPPRGETDINGVREILEEGLARRFSENDSESKHRLVDSVIRMIRLIAGDGPFRTDRGGLVKSIDRFSWLYLVMDKTEEPIDTVLATFLALSFWDVSTSEDHDLLASQFHSVCTTLESQVNAMLADRRLSTFVRPQDVEGVFRSYERGFRSYIDDPLWPVFKFPLTENEKLRLANTLKLRFSQLEALMDEMSLKVRYGGSSAELKHTTVFEIARAAQQLLPQTAFLRQPPYPGVSCRYRGEYGFTVVIRGPLYREGERPREKFRAMKYFHLGHRLDEVTKLERDLTRLAARPSEGAETPPREQEGVDHEAGSPTHIE